MKYKYCHGIDLGHYIITNDENGKIARFANEEDAKLFLGIRNHGEDILFNMKKAHNRINRKVKAIRLKIAYNVDDRYLPKVLEGPSKKSDLEMALTDYLKVLDRYTKIIDILKREG